jgi:hypothetical protein
MDDREIVERARQEALHAYAFQRELKKLAAWEREARKEAARTAREQARTEKAARRAQEIAKRGGQRTAWWAIFLLIWLIGPIGAGVVLAVQATEYASYGK